MKHCNECGGFVCTELGDYTSDPCVCNDNIVVKQKKEIQSLTLRAEKSEAEVERLRDAQKLLFEKITSECLMNMNDNGDYYIVPKKLLVKLLQPPTKG